MPHSHREDVEAALNRLINENAQLPLDLSPSNSAAAGVTEVLQEALKICESRNALYKDNWRVVGEVMAALHPHGLTALTKAHHEKIHLYYIFVTKLTRFATSGLTHRDSLIDMINYAAMLAAMMETEE